jgi:hypothetical protein
MHSLFSLVILSEEVVDKVGDFAVGGPLPLLLPDLREQKFPKYVTEQLVFLYPRTPQLL